MVKKFIPIIFLGLYALSVLAEVEIECGEVFVDSMGLAWLEEGGELFTGTLVCGSSTNLTRTPFVKGVKNGKEVTVTIYPDKTVTSQKDYKHGVATNWCAYTVIGDEPHKKCKPIDCAVQNCR